MGESALGNYIYETKALSREFDTAAGKFIALNNVSITVPKKKLVILRGKSGSGKTTLLNQLGALDRPTGGELLFCGKEIGKITESEREKLRRTQIGFVFQSVSLIPVMSVYENVEFSLRLAGINEDREKIVEKSLEMVGLAKRIKHMPQQLSGGEQQRVAIARAMAHSPHVLLADEPTAELDSKTARSVMKLFRKMVEENDMTIVMTTHDMSLMDEGDIIYTLEEGKLVSE